MRISKRGNSLVVRLPQAVIDALKLKAGDKIEITIAGARSLEIARERNREETIARLRKYRNRLPAELKFDRDKANARC